MKPTVRFALGAATGLVIAALAGCSGSAGPQRVVTVTVPPPSATPTTSASNSPTAPTSQTSATPGAQATLPGTCDDLLTDYSVAQAIGKTTLGATTAFVVGVPEKDIGRLANINCRYGLSGSGNAATSKAEIGISLYATAAQAATRVAGTAGDYTTHGAHVAEVVVGGSRGQLLTGATGTGYTEPTLVVAAGQRTIAVTVSPSLATGTTAAGYATKIAALAVEKSAG